MLSRFSVSMPDELVAALDQMVLTKGYNNRSQAIADMVREQLVAHHSHRDDQMVAGTITLVYDHHKRNIQTLLTDIQHDHNHLIVATMHVHLDHDNCLEVLVVRGEAKQIDAIANALFTAKGIKQGKLTITQAGEHLP
jgi:CopG family nickel-responsive transcriptional regulator